MNEFDKLLDVIALLENSDSRDKAKDFKKRLKPYFKKMEAAQIGDPRRYTFMMVWPFLRDVIGVEDMQGQDTPLNYNNILRKLEEVYDRGELPNDAGDKWEQYANEQFDTFVDSTSATREPRARKSHTRGRDIQRTIAVAGEDGTGFTDGETASERAKRIETEKSLQKEIKQRGPEEVRADFKKALDDISDKLRGISKPGEDKGKGVPEFSETYTQQHTYLIEILFDEPVVQKQPAISLFPEEDLASPIERSQRGFDVELLSSSKIAQQIKYHGVEKVEAYLTKIISNKVGNVGVKVNIMEPETDEPAGKLLGVYKAPNSDAEEDECGFCPKSSHKHSKHNPVDEDEQRPTAETTVILPQGNVTVYFTNGNITEIIPDSSDLKFNTTAVNEYLRKGWKLKDALISGRDTRTTKHLPVMDSVLAYMPTIRSGQEYREPIILETTRERYKPTTNHQVIDYMQQYAK